ncbi:MAG: hypothetical protein ACRDP3_15100 [Streptomyces sp.]|uniref:hypothetical protein n=1 Tax=Streptomyces sp. TaxID=1931 RepID=UPI003D6BCA0A
MSDGSGDLNVSKESLKLIVDGMKAAIGELEETGSGVTSSNRGAGFENLALTNKEAGTGGVASDFEDFCDRWEWGIRALMLNANGLAEKLGLAVGLQHATDEYWSSTFKYGLNSVNTWSNPGLTREQAGKQDWGEILTPDAPDYSAESSTKAALQAREGWENPDGNAGAPAPGDENPQGKDGKR